MALLNRAGGAARGFKLSSLSQHGARHASKRRSLGSSSGAMPAAPPTMTIADLVDRSRPAVSVGVDASVREATQAMAEQRASTLFVQDKGFVVGILKETAIVAHADAAEGDLSARVADVMSAEIAFAHPSSTLRESLELLHRHEQDYLPFLRSASDAQDAVRASEVRMLDVANIISVKQLIGQFYLDAVGLVAEEDVDERVRLETEAQAALGLPSVKAILKAKQERSEAKGALGTMVLNTLVEDEITVAETIGQMRKFNKGSVVLLDRCRDEHVLVGIATEQDIVRRAMALGLDLRETLIADVTSRKDLATVTTRDALLACAYKMVRADVRHLPVVSSKDKRCLAVVSSGDVVSYLCQSFAGADASKAA